MGRKETMARNAAIRRERQEAYRKEREAQIEALRKIRDDPNANPGERLEAVKLLEKEMQY